MKQLFTPPVVKIFHALNDNTRIVGGAIRDSLMGVPVTDIDFASPLQPDIIIQALHQNAIRTFATGLKHGTVTAVVNNVPYEITTLRKDIQTDGRHATVAFTDSYQEDSCRRDFTINALYLDKNGVIYDYTNGRTDIQNKYVRFIGNAKERIAEDYLRILRYFRFWGKMGCGEIDADAIKACTLLSAGLTDISKERKRDELFKIITQPNAPVTLQLMKQTGVLAYLLPRADIVSFEKFIKVYPQAGPLERLSILCPSKVPDLALSNKQKDTLQQFAQSVDMNASVKRLKILFYEKGTPTFRFNVYRALSAGQISSAQAHEYLSWHIPVFPVTGADLLALGYQPGPQIKTALDLAKSIWARYDFTDNKTLVLKALMSYNKR